MRASFPSCRLPEMSKDRCTCDRLNATMLRLGLRQVADLHDSQLDVRRLIDDSLIAAIGEDTVKGRIVNLRLTSINNS